MAEAQTPLMRQYSQIKAKYPDTVLLFRMGDFFETFESDAHIASKVLGITLTKRANGAASDVALAGFPHHALDNYLPKLVKAGYKVAVCEQLEDPRFAKGIVKRDVIEVVTPGITFSDKLLDHKSNNYIACLFVRDEKCGFAFCDISTGEFLTCEIPFKNIKEQIELINPSEIIISKTQKNLFSDIFDYERAALTLNKVTITKLDEWLFNTDYCTELLVSQFKTKSLKGFGIELYPLGIIAAGGILSYINETQKGNLAHINKISYYDTSDYIVLDSSTKRNLEIISSMAEGSREGTLISILDKTQTAMGARLLKNWISRPLKKLAQIHKRQECVSEFYENKPLRSSLMDVFKNIGDLERLISKIATSRAVARDLINLKYSLKNIALIKEHLSKAQAKTLKDINSNLKELDELVKLIDESINEDLSMHSENKGVIKSSYNKELDELRHILNSGEAWLENYQRKERERTKINSLKVSFNKVFGYYIEISKANLTKANSIEGYIRKQTLVNAERFITQELKEYEEKILSANEKITTLEASIFNDIRLKIVEYASEIQMNGAMIGILDVLLGFAEAAEEYKYTKPDINESDIIEITYGRHPVIEQLLPAGEKYVPNDTHLDPSDSQIIIITGPNMSGKSSYLRQVGLIVLLAQIGSFVPAKKASIGICDRIFTRVGAMDNIARGESTFLIEMQESANILNNLTAKSLVLLDEVGRGTSTYDGISIAWAITEFIHENPSVKAKTLFATHYHELNALASLYTRIKNSRVEVKEVGDKVIFLHKINEGTADHSFGIHVAQMAGLPDAVTKRAKEILSNLEKREERSRRKDEFQINLFEYKDNELNDIIDKIDLNKMTPLEALNKLQELKKLSQNK
ncbi:MAG: DNA mismatch repair protein MutS [Chlorobi bacterium]|nr:DNA mismatch repair protein MutS [Chlorobiota bacterium]MCI0716989.1 DNA mismatch repair protein MutS [Chlorobiota bacterium]